MIGLAVKAHEKVRSERKKRYRVPTSVCAQTSAETDERRDAPTPSVCDAANHAGEMRVGGGVAQKNSCPAGLMTGTVESANGCCAFRNHRETNPLSLALTRPTGLNQPVPGNA